MSDVSRKIVPDKWSLNREPTGNQRPKVSILHKKEWGFDLFSFELERNVREGVCTKTR